MLGLHYPGAWPASAVGRRQKLRRCLCPKHSLSLLALPSAPWGCVSPSVQGSADCSKASASSVCACLRPASDWAGTCLLHWTSSVYLCSVNSSNLYLLGLGRHGVCVWVRAGGKEPGSCASTLLCNQTSTGEQEQDWDIHFKSVLLLLNRADVNPGSESWMYSWLGRMGTLPFDWASLYLSLYITYPF